VSQWQFLKPQDIDGGNNRIWQVVERLFSGVVYPGVDLQLAK